jgi:hypothetical protein
MSCKVLTGVTMINVSWTWCNAAWFHRTCCLNLRGSRASQARKQVIQLQDLAYHNGNLSKSKEIKSMR